MKKLTRNRAGALAAMMTGMLSAGVVVAEDVEGFSNSDLAQIHSVYFNASEPKPSSTEALTYARMTAVRDAFDAVLLEGADVDGLSAAQFERIGDAYDRVLSGEEQLVLLDSAPVLTSSSN